MNNHFAVGQIVEIPVGSGVGAKHEGKPLRITKINPTTLQVEDEHGALARGAHHLYAPTTKSFVPVAVDQRIDVGVVVTMKPSRSWGFAPDRLFVVIKADGGDRVNVVALGGDGGRYWRVPVSDLTVVPIGEITRNAS